MAAMASLAESHDYLTTKVVPAGQAFDMDYAGIFLFRSVMT